MRKSILSSLTLVVSMAILTVNTYAMPNSSETQPIQTKMIKSTQVAPATSITTLRVKLGAADSISQITGTIEKIDEYDMIVKTKDGKSYIIPVHEFSKMEKFKELKLQEGTEVSLKGGQFPKFNLNAGVVTGEVSVALKAIPSDAATIGELPEGIKTIRISNEELSKEGKQSIRMYSADAKEIVSVVATKPISKETMAAATVTSNKELTVENKEGIKIFSTDAIEAKGAVKAIAVTVSGDYELFFAEEITASGNTVKLQ